MLRFPSEVAVIEMYVERKLTKYRCESYIQKSNVVTDVENKSPKTHSFAVNLEKNLTEYPSLSLALQCSQHHSFQLFAMNVER